MNVDSALAARLVAFLAPIAGLWLLIGLGIAVLYHLSLIRLSGEFRARGQESLDLLMTILRSVAFIVGWPFILYFDRTSLTQIRLLLLSLSRKQREQNDDVKDALAEAAYWQWIRQTFVEQDRLERRRKEEAETGEERQRLLRVLHEDNPELESIWMLTGVGSHPGGVRELVRLYPDYHLAQEIAEGAKREIEMRRPWSCPRCNERLEPESVELPELIFLRILNWETDKTLIEGWALCGEYRMRFASCPKCGAEQPVLAEEVCRFGRASEVARLAREGLSVHWDLA